MNCKYDQVYNIEQQIMQMLWTWKKDKWLWTWMMIDLTQTTDHCLRLAKSKKLMKNDFSSESILELFWKLVNVFHLPRISISQSKLSGWDPVTPPERIDGIFKGFWHIWNGCFGHWNREKNRENHEFKEFSFEVQLRLCLFII